MTPNLPVVAVSLVLTLLAACGGGSNGGSSANTSSGSSSSGGAPPSGASSPPTSDTVVISVAGGGTISSSGGAPNISACGNADSGTTKCSGTFPSGTTVVLTATPTSGYNFVGWFSNTASGGANAVSCTGTTTCSFTKTTTTQWVTAVFAPPSGVAPVLAYQDILSGPVSGGEGNNGIYLSVFGKNFGGSGLGTTIKVYLDNMEVAVYKTFGPSRGRTDIQQITVQPGALNHPTAGTALPIKVVVDGRVALNPASLSFTANPGNIYFVNTASGVDTATTNTGGTFSAPFKTVQKAGFGTSFSIDAASQSGAYGRVRAGDFIVLRGGHYSDVGFNNYFMNALNKSGCPVGTNCAQGGGASSGPITIMGYPGENAFIDRSYSGSGSHFGGGFSSADSTRQALGYGAWWTIANLVIESGFDDGPVNTQRGELNPLGSHWRVVNNEMSAVSCQQQSLCRAGGVSGNGSGNYWVGNHIHDVYDKADGSTDMENHGIYIGNAGSYEVAYNRIENIFGGNGVQTNSNGGQNITNLNLHHNLIKGVGKHGINMADVTTGLVIHNNVVLNTDCSGLRFNSDALSGAKVFNNTFYNTDRLNTYASVRAALDNDGNLAAGALEIRNNIFVPGNGSRYYMGGNVGFSASAVTMSNNLWFNGAGSVLGAANVTTDPRFVSLTPGSENLQLQAGSPGINAGTSAVSAIVVDDYDIATTSSVRTLRPIGGGYDIGAYER